MAAFRHVYSKFSERTSCSDRGDGTTLTPVAKYPHRVYGTYVRGSVSTLEETAWLLAISFLYKQPFAPVHFV